MRGRIALSSATADRTPPMRTAMSPATPALHSPPRPPQFGPSLAQHLERHLAVQDAILTARSLCACPCARGRSSAGRPNGDRRAQVPQQRAPLSHEQIAAQQQELLAHRAASRRRRHRAQVRARGREHATEATLRSLSTPTMPTPTLQLACVECTCRMSMCVQLCWTHFGPAGTHALTTNDH